ncbi:MAG TPA: aldolase [archaeon]|nr:aldolase [archaeon]
MKSFMSPFLENEKGMLLAYDQGLEHGPSKDFNDKSVEPNYILEIAEKGKFTGIIFQKGVAEKYYDGKVPLIVKVNGKTSLPRGEPVAAQNCTVKHAKALGAQAVGYTIYLGSAHESVMLHEFGQIQEEAHELGLAAITWVYPRGEAVPNDSTREIVAYAARAGLEAGADAVKIKYTGDPESFRWAVKSAGAAKVFMSGGPKAPTDEAFLNQVKGVIDAGGSGLAVGRNVWQHDRPLEMAAALRHIIFNGQSVERALKEFSR